MRTILAFSFLGMISCSSSRELSFFFALALFLFLAEPASFLITNSYYGGVISLTSIYSFGKAFHLAHEVICSRCHVFAPFLQWSLLTHLAVGLCDDNIFNIQCHGFTRCQYAL
jgi:hypothetical protein